MRTLTHFKKDVVFLVVISILSLAESTGWGAGGGGQGDDRFSSEDETAPRVIPSVIRQRTGESQHSPSVVIDILNDVSSPRSSLLSPASASAPESGSASVPSAPASSSTRLGHSYGQLTLAQKFVFCLSLFGLVQPVGVNYDFKVLDPPPHSFNALSTSTVQTGCVGNFSTSHLGSTALLLATEQKVATGLELIESKLPQIPNKTEVKLLDLHEQKDIRVTLEHVKALIRSGMDPKEIVVIFDIDGTLTDYTSAANLPMGMKMPARDGAQEVVQELSKLGVVLIASSADKSIQASTGKLRTLGIEKEFGVTEECSQGPLQLQYERGRFVRWGRAISVGTPQPDHGIGYDRKAYAPQFLDKEQFDRIKRVVFVDDRVVFFDFFK